MTDIEIKRKDSATELDRLIRIEPSWWIYCQKGKGKANMLSPTGCIAHTIGSYSKNPVMQVIGKQQYPIGTDAAKDTQMILNAYLEDLKTRGKRGEAISNIAIDVFLLGMIYGKREERRKRREKVNKLEGAAV